MKLASAKCPCCSYKVKLRKDGTIGAHTLFSGLRHNLNDSYRLKMEALGRVYLIGGGYRCEGIGKLPENNLATSGEQSLHS